jgi:hypothetical protein
MSSHTLRLILPGTTETADPVTTATATITNLHYPHARGELSGAGGLTLSEWGNTTFNTAMSPVYDIAHVFTEPVRSFTSPTGSATGELVKNPDGTSAEGILFGYFESIQIGDYTQDPQWGEIFMFTNQTVKANNGMYIALPGDVGSSGNRLIRAFRKLGDYLSHQFAAVEFRANAVNVNIVTQADKKTMHIQGIAADATNLTTVPFPFHAGGMPLEATPVAWGASGESQAGSSTTFTWINPGDPFYGPQLTPFVYLALGYQTDPTENGVYKYDFATGNKTTAGGVPYREFTRLPIGIPNGGLLNSNPTEYYFSFNVRASNGALHYGQVSQPESDLQFGTGSLALLLEDPGDHLYNKPVTTLTPQTRSADIYTYTDIAGYQLADGSWLFGTAEGHDAIFILRATEAGGVFTAGSSDADYRTAPVGTLLSDLTIIDFEALPLAEDYGVVVTPPPLHTYLFLSNAVLSVEAGAVVSPVKSGRIEIGKEFEANQVALTHTAFYASTQTELLDELRLRGLAVTFGHLLHGHGHSHSGSGNERSRQPHFHVHIDHGKTSTMVSRHNMHYKSMHIPHLIDFQYVYEDDGKPLSDNHARAIGQVVLTLTFEGFTV